MLLSYQRQPANEANIYFAIENQSAVGELEFATSTGGGGGSGGGGTGGGGGTTTSNVPADVFVSSVTIVIPAGQTTGSVTIMGDGDTVASDESIDITAFEISGGAYGPGPTGSHGDPNSQCSDRRLDQRHRRREHHGQRGNGRCDRVHRCERKTTLFDPTSDPFTTTNGSGAYGFDGLQITTPTTDTVSEDPALRLYGGHSGQLGRCKSH